MSTIFYIVIQHSKWIIFRVPLNFCWDLAVLSTISCKRYYCASQCVINFRLITGQFSYHWCPAVISLGVESVLHFSWNYKLLDLFLKTLWETEYLLWRFHILIICSFQTGTYSTCGLFLNSNKNNTIWNSEMNLEKQIICEIELESLMAWNSNWLLIPKIKYKIKPIIKLLFPWGCVYTVEQIKQKAG